VTRGKVSTTRCRASPPSFFGGTSLRGGRGTLIGTVLGAVLLTEVLNAVAFLGLTETYQYAFQGRPHRNGGTYLFGIPSARRSLRSMDSLREAKGGRT